MATYKKPCERCGGLVNGDARFCPSCGGSPFGYLCPSCLKPIERAHMVCSGCGRSVYIPCPFCGGQTFIGETRCDACGVSLMVPCQNPRCGQMQFFQNTMCTACGKKIKIKKR